MYLYFTCYKGNLILLFSTSKAIVKEKSPDRGQVVSEIYKVLTKHLRDRKVSREEEK